MSQIRTPRRSPRILIAGDNISVHADFKTVLAHATTAGATQSPADRGLFSRAGAVVVDQVLFRVESSNQGEDALTMVREAVAQGDPFALALVDLRVSPEGDGFKALEQLWEASPELQIVLCTERPDFSWEQIFERFGCRDNLLILKRPFEAVEMLQIVHAMTLKWAMAKQARLHLMDLDRMVCQRTQELQLEIEDHAKAQEALRVSEERFAKAFRASPLPMAIKSLPEGRYLDANNAFLALAGLSSQRLMGRNDDELRLWEDSSSLQTAAAQSQHRIRNHPLVLRGSDVALRNVLFWSEPVTLDTNPCLLVIVQDVTARMKLEAELRQTQKLDLVGRLTASVAHEFNNLLTVIQGHASLLKADPSNAKLAADAADRISQASQRAGAFTGQLLAFSRKQPVLNLKSVNLSEATLNMRKTLEQLLGERHTLKLDCEMNIALTRLNDGAFEQVLVNLVLNARDALSDGGDIHVGTRLETVDNAAASRHPNARTGLFVCLTVRDTGCGMTREILERIFDPFFTTKEVGKGTGLGLPTVLGIVQQHNGWIEVTSQPGRGSTFQVFLPVTEAASTQRKMEQARPRTAERGDGETVLVVEDDRGVRELARVALEHGGYRVIEAADGVNALKIWDETPGRISVLITDMVLPNGISGGTLAKTLQKKGPSLRIICVSGYNPEFIKKDLPEMRGIVFLPKPYDSQTLLDAVKQSARNCGNGNQACPSPKPNEPRTIIRGSLLKI